jgi:hypothetical protein
MADHGCDQDATWKWAFRKSYKRQPKPEELQRYKYWHGVSRQISFAAAGPWDCWPSKAIPDDAQPVLEAADAVEDTGVHVATGAEPRRRHARPRAKERAEAFGASNSQTGRAMVNRSSAMLPRPPRSPSAR